MVSLSSDAVAAYAAKGPLSQNDLIEIGKKIPMSLRGKLLRIIAETFSFITFIKQALSGYFALRAVEEIGKYNIRFVKNTFFPTEGMLASIKNLLETHSTTVINADNELYRKIDRICKVHLIIAGSEKDTFLVKAYDISTKKERQRLLASRIDRLRSQKPEIGNTTEESDSSSVAENTVPDSGREKISEKLYANFLKSPSYYFNSILLELTGKFLEETSKLEKHLKVLSPAIDYLCIETLVEIEAPTDIVKTHIDSFLKLLKERELPSAPLDSESWELWLRERKIELAPDITGILKNTIDAAFIKINAQKVKKNRENYPILSRAIGPLFGEAFKKGYLHDFARSLAIKSGAHRALNYYFELQESCPDKNSLLRAADDALDILIPVITRLDDEYKIVKQYEVAAEITALLIDSSSEEMKTIERIKALIYSITVDNFDSVYVPVNKLVKKFIE